MKRWYIRAEEVKVDTDEGRYTLEVSVDGEPGLIIDVHDCVLDFYAQVQKHIRPYVLEAEDARATVPQLVTNRPVDVYDAIDAGYALDDPKSPGYHDRMVGDN